MGGLDGELFDPSDGLSIVISESAASVAAYLCISHFLI